VKWRHLKTLGVDYATIQKATFSSPDVVILHSMHKFKETQFVHSATELNKIRAQWSKLYFKTKRNGFGGGSG
jgi:hypothetical protein